MPAKNNTNVQLGDGLETLSLREKVAALHSLLNSLGGDSMPHLSWSRKKLSTIDTSTAVSDLQAIGAIARYEGTGTNRITVSKDGLVPNELIPSHTFDSEDSNEPDWRQPYRFTTGAMLKAMDPKSPTLVPIITGDGDMGEGGDHPQLALVKQHIGDMRDLSAYAAKFSQVVKKDDEITGYTKNLYLLETQYKDLLAAIEVTAKSIYQDLEGRAGEQYQQQVQALIEKEKQANIEREQQDELSAAQRIIANRQNLLDKAIKKATRTRG